MSLEIALSLLKEADDNLKAAETNVNEALRTRAAAAMARLRAEGLVETERELEAGKIPVDRSKVQLTDGTPVPADRSHIEDRGDGQQKGYVVLAPEERAKGFVRPYRDAYRHDKCGKVTTMGRSLSETYARDPFFYNGTFCASCGNHYPVGADGEFVWLESNGDEIHRVGV